MKDERAESAVRSRREWLGAVWRRSCRAGSWRVCAPGAASRPALTTLPALGSQPTTPPVSDAAKSIVVHLRAEEVLSGSKVHPSLAGEMVEEAIKTLTGRAKAADAWNRLLQSDDKIAIKFNHVGAETLGTTVPVRIATGVVAGTGGIRSRPDHAGGSAGGTGAADQDAAADLRMVGPGGVIRERRRATGCLVAGGDGGHQRAVSQDAQHRGHDRMPQESLARADSKAGPLSRQRLFALTPATLWPCRRFRRRCGSTWSTRCRQCFVMVPKPGWGPCGLTAA